MLGESNFNEILLGGITTALITATCSRQKQHV